MSQLDSRSMSDREKVGLVEVMAPFTYLNCSQVGFAGVALAAFEAELLCHTWGWCCELRCSGRDGRLFDGLELSWWERGGLMGWGERDLTRPRHSL